MKTLFTLFFACAITSASYSQQITSMTISPANPLTTDTIKIYVTNDFPSSSCFGTANFMVSGNSVYANAMHCMGMLSALCTDVDTIKINPPHAAGSYTFYFTLDSGYEPSCTPGIVSDDTDTLFYNVSVPTGLSQNSKYNKFSVSPNPTKGIVILNTREELRGQLKITNLIGQTVFESAPAGPVSKKIDLSGYAPGVYFLIYEEENKIFTQKIVLEN
ncbi:MAG: Secretion system C-terminal sorting domain [Bacteroidetes bacterium]|jgi:hypothetical protein|nr:Secretion system C-terminal sorting domain [Bacteroidota bacterium]